MFSSLPSKTLFLSVCAFVLVFSTTSSQEAPQIALPQSFRPIKPEENLMCLLNAMRQFDFKRTTADLPKLEHLNRYLQPGVDRPIDLNTFLLQFYDLFDIDDKVTGVKFEPRKMIADCNLNLAPALERCETAYKGTFKCEQVAYGADKINLAPFVAPICPEGYQRYGSSKCLRKCNYRTSIHVDESAGETDARPWTGSNYCLKKPTMDSNVVKFSTKEEMQAVGDQYSNYEILHEKDDEYVYVQNCPQDWRRIGSRGCMALCPLGWADLGNKCAKAGPMIFFPFVWTPGDGNLEAGAGGAGGPGAPPAGDVPPPPKL